MGVAEGFRCKNPKCECHGLPAPPPNAGLPADDGQVRTFESGATRDTNEGKLDFEAFLSPRVLLRYAEYMSKHQTRSDGTRREGDDWQKGMPSDVYMKSMMRHIMDVWLLHRGYTELARTDDMGEALCAVIFNAMGLLFNELEGLK